MLAAGLALPAAAQAPGFLSPEVRSRQLQVIERTAAYEAAHPDEAAKALAEKRQRDFTILMADFANSWNRLVQVAGRGGWNAKEARKTREAFERLAHSEGWIEESKAAGAKDTAARPKLPAPSGSRPSGARQGFGPESRNRGMYRLDAALFKYASARLTSGQRWLPGESIFQSKNDPEARATGHGPTACNNEGLCD